MDQKARHQKLRQYFDEAAALTGTAKIDLLAAVSAADAQLGDALVELLRSDAEQVLRATQKPAMLIAASFESLDDAYWLGRTVGRYRIESRLGIGGMGQVFLCRRLEGDIAQRVALKIVRRDAMTANLAKRFDDERQILASLQHPGIAHFIDAGIDHSGLPFFVMEYIDGVPFSRYCEQHNLNIAQRIALFRKIVAAVSYAHRHLVIHRDLKPSNVLITAEGEAKLLDFGIAKVLGDNHQTATSERAFTLAYAAPEQLTGRNIGIACDIYGLGALLYEALCGAPPFDMSQASAELVEKQIKDTPPKPLTHRLAARSTLSHTPIARHWRRALVGDLESIVQKALRKEPEARYRSADEFDGDLQSYLEGRAVQASGGGSFYRLEKFVARHRWSCAVAAIFLASLCAAFVIIVSQNIAIAKARDRAESARSIAQTELARASALSAFLNDDLISRANPLVAAKGAEANLRDVLLAARERVKTRFANQPASEASVRGSLGGLFESIDLWAEAETETRQALRLHLAQSGKSSADVLRMRSRLSRLLCKLSRFDEAKSELATLETDAKGLVDAETRFLLSAAWSSYHLTRGDYVKALPQLELAVKSLRTYAPENTTQRDALRVQLIFAYTLTEHFDRAQSEGHALISEAQARTEDSALTVALAKIALARSYSKQKHDDQALALLLEAEPVVVERLGQGHSRHLLLLGELMGVAFRKPDWPKALTYAETLYTLLHAKVGAQSLQTQVVAVNWARALYESGDVEGAAKRLREPFRQLVISQGKDSTQSQDAAYLLACIELERRDLDAAEALINDIDAKILIAAAGNDEWGHAVNALRGLLLLERGDKEAARPIMKAALEGLKLSDAASEDRFYRVFKQAYERAF